MTRHAVFGQVAAVSFAVGCLALTAVSQQETQPGARPRPAADTPQRTGNVNFILYSDCKGKEVTSQNGEEIGTLENAIVERGSQRAKFFVIDADNRMTAVPFHAFRWDAANDQFMLTVGEDQLRTMPEFDEKRWEQLATTRDTNDPLVQALMRESSWPQRDLYLTGDQASLETINLEGEITRVEYRDIEGMAEQIVLHVRSDSFGENGRPGVGNEPGRPTTPPRGNSDPNDPNDPQREPGTQDRPGATPDRPQTPGTTRPTQSQAGNVKVALGPSWYVMSRADAIPMRGHSFDGEVAELERARGDVKYVAISCKINGKDLQLRDPNTKQPMWLFGAPMDRPATQPRTTDPNRPTRDPNLDDDDNPRPGAGDPAGTGGNPTMPPGEPVDPDEDDEDRPGTQDRPGTPPGSKPSTPSGMARATTGLASVGQSFYLLSDVHDGDVEFRGEDGGKIKDCILEQNSGTVAFFAVDPDENFLGIGDETRLIPAQLVYVGTDNKVRIDATKEMLEKSIELPDEMNTLQGQYQQVYRTFDVEAPKFQATRPRTGGTMTDPNRPATDRPTDRPGTTRPGERPNDRP